MRKTAMTVALVAALAAAPAVQAKGGKAAPAPAPTKAQLMEAQQTLGLIVSAINSKDVPQQTKNGLFGCLYQNSLHKIAAGAQTVLNQHKEIDRTNPTQRLLVIASVCGAPVPSGPPKKVK